MDITVIQAILIAGVVALTNLDGNFFGEMKFREPIVTGFLVGLILGDVPKGLIIGAELQIIWMGATGIGPTAQLDIGAGGTIGTAVALLTGKGAEVAITFGLPVAVIMQFLNTLLMTLYSVLMHHVDNLIDELKEKQMVFIHILCGMITALMYGSLTFVVMYFGNNTINAIVKGLPAWANRGLNAVAVVLPVQIDISKSYVPNVSFNTTGLVWCANTIVQNTSSGGNTVSTLYYRTVSGSQQTDLPVRIHWDIWGFWK